MLASGFNVLRSFLNSEPPPNKVLDMRSDNFLSRSVHLREDGLVLYLPANNMKNKDEKSFSEIVLHTETHHTYSLFRTSNLDEAELRFVTLKEKLPIFVEVVKEMCNVQGLQKISDTLAEHPSWNLAHLAAHFGLHEAFKNPQVSTFLNNLDDETGISPLQVAITTKNLKTVQVLVASNCSLEYTDHNNDSVFHYAAITTKEIISLLAQGSSPLKGLNDRNKNGCTPLHIACQGDKPDCVRALLLAGADVNITSMETTAVVKPGYVGDFLHTYPNSLFKEDMKCGGTPLHWACSRPVIDALIDMNCNINALNFEQKSALHIMVLRNRLECVVALLSHQAEINLGDADGNRPIHLAVKQANIPIMQCLIIFGADLNVLNNAGESPRHLVTEEQAPKILYYLHAVGAKRCPTGTDKCTNGCKSDGTNDGIPPPRPIGPTCRDGLNQMLDVATMEVAAKNHEKKKHGRLLCLDGGGIRGLVLVEMLLEIEKVLQKPINHCFEWIAGTSTGGILALGIASGKTMRECLCLYFRIKEKTFVGMRPYASEPLENVLKENFGSETVMADIPHPKVMVTAVLADRIPAELHLFRNYESANDIMKFKHDSPYELPPPPKEQYVWEVGRATGAAPTYFRAFGRYLDGGLIANNPTLDALSEIREYNLALRAVQREEDTVPVSVVVSLGTGLIPVTQVKEIDVFLPGNILDGIKLYTGISALGTLLVDQATASDGRVVDRARAWCSLIGVPYFRLSPQMSENIAMNESTDEKLCKMLWETKAYMYENMKTVRELVDVLNRD